MGSNLDTHEARTEPSEKRRKKGGFLLLAVALLLVGSTTAGVLLRQDAQFTSDAVPTDVAFAQGSGHAAIQSAGYGSVSIGASEASATMHINAVPGAALLSLSDMMSLTNRDAVQSYNAFLSSSDPAGAEVEGLRIKVYGPSGAIVADWDPLASGSSSSFALAPGGSYSISVDITVADGTPPGALDLFDIQVSLSPA